MSEYPHVESPLLNQIKEQDSHRASLIVAAPGRQLGRMHSKRFIPLSCPLKRNFCAEMCRVKKPFHHPLAILGWTVIEPGLGRFWNFPYAAIEEAMVNAVYHRSYEEREPIEVRITPEDLVVLSFPGPDRSIRMEDLRAGKAVSRRYRNRRIGEFLKELDLTEGRSTGIPKILKVMAENGSPAPEFETDDDRTYFLIRLPIHQQALQEATLQVTGQVTGQVTEQIHKLLLALEGEMTRGELQAALGLAHRDYFTEAYLQPALEAGLIEMTIPDKPRSSKQKYRLSAAGMALVKQ